MFILVYQEGSMLTENPPEWNIRVGSAQLLSYEICSVCLHMNFVNGLSITNSDVLNILNEINVSNSEPLSLNSI